MKKFWQKLAARERLAVTSTMAFLVIALLWQFAVAPALKTLRDAPAALAAMDTGLAGMRAQAQQLQTLRSAPRRAPPTDFVAQVSAKAKAALGSAGRVTAGPAEVRAAIDSIAPAQALALLQDVADSAQARAEELAITANGNGTVKLGVKWVAR